MPRYAALIYGADDAPRPSPEDWQRVMAEYNEFGANAGAAGVIGGGEALQSVTDRDDDPRRRAARRAATSSRPTARSPRRRRSLGGFYLLDCKDLDEALHGRRRSPAPGTAASRCVPVIDFSQDG